VKPLVLSVSAACLLFIVAACGSGGGGARSAGSAPSVSVETAARTTTTGATVEDGHGSIPSMFDYFDQAVAYEAQADAICDAATGKLEAAFKELPGGANDVTVDDLAFEVAGKALAKLRSLPPPGAAPAANPVPLCSHRGGTQAGVDSPTRAEFISRATVVCAAASAKLGFPRLWTPGETLRAARIDEEALAKLRALPQPAADRALLEEAFYSVVDREITALREQAASTSAGDAARAVLLGYERVHLTHQRDGFAVGYGLQGTATWACPVALPA
jgi:hypothetical protein